MALASKLSLLAGYVAPGTCRIVTMAGRLTHPVTFPKLEILPEELRTLISGKVQSIQRGTLTQQITESVIEVSKLLGRKTKQNSLENDERYTISNANYIEVGASPSGLSPQEAASANPDFVANQASDLHEDQEILFSRLIEDLKLDKEFGVEGGTLKINGKALTYVELCNTLDEVTKLFMGEERGNSTTSRMEQGERLKPIYDLCNAVAAKRLSLHATIEDDILDGTDGNQGYQKWKKHITIIASFTALMVSLHRLAQK